MKILLTRPITPKGMTLNIMPPLGLGYLASAIRKQAAGEVRILDCLNEGYNFAKFSEYIRNFSPDIVGFHTFSHDIAMVNKSIELIKEINPLIITIVGGPHPSGVGIDCLRHIPKADFGFKGEAEISLPQFIKIISKSKNSSLNEEELKDVPGLIWRKKDGTVALNQQFFFEDLDSLNLPSWDLMDPNTYPHAPQGLIFRNLPFAPILVTRGCPYHCTFCASKTILGEKIRSRSIKNVINEIELLYNQYKVREIHILDDNFTIDKGYAQSFSQEIINHKLEITWCCPNGVRLDTLDRETLLWMKKSGCYYISVGVESGSDRILKLMKKGLTINQINEKINQIKELGFDVNAFFIIGYPGETEEDILQTIRFAKSLPLARVAFYSFLPLPGTEIYEQLRQSKEIDEPQWDEMFQAMHPYCPKGISCKRLDELQHKAYREFYLRPKILFALLKEIKTFNQFSYIIRRAKTYLGLNF